MTIIELPDYKEFNRRYYLSPFPEINKKLLILDDIEPNRNGIIALKNHLDLQEFILQLHHRVLDAAKSYVLLTYFFDMGIPDTEWHRSPARSGSSIEYFTHFEQIHFHIKDWFDFYADVFNYKAFSALDLSAQILNLHLGLKLKEKQVTFARFVSVLKNKDRILFDKLDKIYSSHAFALASELRNSSTHRCSPTTGGIAVTTQEKGWSIGLRKYVTSKEIRANSDEVATILEKVISIMLERIKE